MLAVCHVMRYFPPCVKIKEIIDSGKIGKLILTTYDLAKKGHENHKKLSKGRLAHPNEQCSQKMEESYC